jgi:putative DNA primase/helicase
MSYAENYSAVVATLQDLGLIVERLDVGTERPVRCKAAQNDHKKSGWYHLSYIRFHDAESGTEKDYLVGAAGVWKGNDNGRIKIVPDKQFKLSPEQRQAIADRMAADQTAAKLARKNEIERACEKARDVWRLYQPTGTSDYLTTKGVQAYGLRFHPKKDTAAVPMTDLKGAIFGLQLLRGEDRGQRLRKTYWPTGLDKVGKFHLIGDLNDTLLIVEGYATAASIHAETGLPVAVAFDASNIAHVAKIFRKKYPQLTIIIAADDDYRCAGGRNTGVETAKNVAVAVNGHVIIPQFTVERPADKPESGGDFTDFNDLVRLEGADALKNQFNAFLIALNGAGIHTAPITPAQVGSKGRRNTERMISRISIEDAATRYWGTYGLGGKVLFDEMERRLIAKEDVVNLLPASGWERLRDHPDWRVARDNEIGFDPTEQDQEILCNLYGGFPTTPKHGNCERQLELLEYLCGGDTQGSLVYEWVLNWLAYPLQFHGAKMHSALVFHGGQGAGKNLFFEGYARIYGEYGRLLGQEALEDKFNSDWAEKKLFIVADEILARQDMYHVKNRLKGFITGGTIRVNPKNVAAHNEKNHMNIVFLSNERQPLVLEHDDRRYCVVWTPPKLSESFYTEIAEEQNNGGIEALHYFLMQRDLTGFNVASKPPMTQAKAELIQQSSSSEERFTDDWLAGELLNERGEVFPVCACAGTDLYRAYQLWCGRNGERVRRLQDVIGHIGKRPGFTAGKGEWTRRNLLDEKRVLRKLVVPNDAAVIRAANLNPTHQRLAQSNYGTRIEWLTVGYFAFQDCLNVGAGAGMPDSFD